MYANISTCEKIPLLLQLIPVYLSFLLITFSMNFTIIFEKNENFYIRILALFLYDPIALLILITHTKAMCTDPGYVPIPFEPYEQIHHPSIRYQHIFCGKCNNPRPLRAHHCEICKKCTLKMDHHCPWVFDCIGYYNQKNFYQFLFYSTFGNLIACAFLFYRVLTTDFTIHNYVPRGIVVHNPFELIIYMFVPLNILFSCMTAFALFIAVGSLFASQTIMIFNNQTTIEKKKFEDWEKSPFYEKDKMKNFRSVMGNNFLDWISLDFKGKALRNKKAIESSINIDYTELKDK